MNIYLAKFDPERKGGGWTFQRNLAKKLGDDITLDYQQADIYFITSPSMVSRDEVEQAKRDGKKIVLRLDNAVRNSRNRNTGMTRMKDFADWADLLIYQSDWAKDYLIEFLGKDGLVIVNGVDMDLYHRPEQRQPNDVILYSRYNRDETKNWEVARYWFSREYYQQPDSQLYIVGQFSDELRNGNFDFYNNEAYQYLGVVGEASMAKLYRVCNKFLYTYYNDACSNTLLEALASGCEIVGPEYFRFTGGAPELIALYEDDPYNISLERMASEYKEALERL